MFRIICGAVLFILLSYVGKSEQLQAQNPGRLITLNEGNWERLLEGEWMVEFFAPWCPACKSLAPIWDEFSRQSNILGIHIAQIDVTVAPGLSGRFMVTALPTIFHVKDGIFRQYKGSRSIDAFKSFIQDKRWKKVDPIPNWKSPASYQMSALAYFFELSQLLRSMHMKLTSDFGLPTWASYLIFAIVTIFLGALIGLAFVCFIDVLYPPKVAAPPVEKPAPDELHDLIDDIAEQDEIVDDQSASATESATEKPSPSFRKRKARKAD